MDNAPPSPALHRYAIALAGWAAFVVFAGAMVTSTGSGMAVPDWPLSFGKFFPEMTGGVFYEHGHRMVAGLLALGVLGLALAARKAAPAPRRLALAAGLAVLAQAGLGGITVLLGTARASGQTDPWISALHGSLAQLLFASLVAFAVISAPGWGAPGRRLPASPRQARLAALLALLIFLQIVVGAVMRHHKAGLAIADFPLNGGGLLPAFDSWLVGVNFAHRCGAWLLFLAGGHFAGKLAFARTADAWVKAPARVLAGALVLQFLLGASVVWTAKAWPALTSAHVLGGSAVFASSIALALRLRRLAAA